VPKTEAQIKLQAWHDVGRWLAWAAAEFTSDAATRGYLEHVGVCVRDEGERRYAEKAGFDTALAASG
jgi:hypothetical protein